jgi:alanyl-tRNA synthetase
MWNRQTDPDSFEGKSTMSNIQASANKVGERFGEYYESLGYKVIPGSSLLDPSVPMTFVMSAGLVQVETSARLHGGRTESRYALIQNCFRYFDLANVGSSAAHLSLFQMPGAFTFGPLSKRDSIAQIWQLLTQVYGFPPKSLWATYFAGGQVARRWFEPDVESQRAWREVGPPDSRIVGLGGEHNFWKQGAGVVSAEQMLKCGPNTEVFFDRGLHLSCGPTCRPGCRCGRFVEFLNTLFITLHIDEHTNVVKPLEEPFTETVIGAERVAMLLQGVSSVYEIDSIRPLIERVRAYVWAHNLTTADQIRHECTLADHVRAILFLTADGAPPPGRGGRARLMRKLVREMLTSQMLLGIGDSGFISSLAQTAVSLYGEQQPQLFAAQARVSSYVATEQNRFERTLEDGRHHLNRILNRRGNREFGPQDALEMERRHGVPRPLLEAMLVQQKVDFSRLVY